jgi:FO synthase subunit 2
MHLDALLYRLQDGRRLSALEALELMKRTHRDDIAEVQAVADQFCQHLHGPQVGVQVDVPLFFTNLCELRPTIYGYPRRLGDPDAFVVSIDEVDALLESARDIGATRILVTGGLFANLELPGLEAPGLLKTYGRLLSHIREQAPALHIEAYSPDEIELLRVVSGRSVHYILEMLQDCGMSSLSGCGAEILVDAVRQKISPKKLLVKDWLDVMACAHSLGLSNRLVSGYGHLETNSQRVEHLVTVRAFLQKHPGAFQSLVPLPVQGAESLPIAQTHVVRPLPPAGRLLQLAVMRLFLAGDVAHLATYWTTDPFKHSLQESQEGLQAGANRLGTAAQMGYAAFLAGRRSHPLLSAAELSEWVTQVQRQPVVLDAQDTRPPANPSGS